LENKHHNTMKPENYKTPHAKLTNTQIVNAKIKAKQALYDKAHAELVEMGTKHKDWYAKISEVNNLSADIATLNDKLKTKPQIYGSEIRI